MQMSTNFACLIFSGLGQEWGKRGRCNTQACCRMHQERRQQTGTGRHLCGLFWSRQDGQWQLLRGGILWLFREEPRADFNSRNQANKQRRRELCGMQNVVFSDRTKYIMSNIEMKICTWMLNFFWVLNFYSKSMPRILLLRWLVCAITLWLWPYSKRHEKKYC